MGIVNNPFRDAIDYLESQGYQRPTSKTILIDTEHLKKEYDKFVEEINKQWE